MWVDYERVILNDEKLLGNRIEYVVRDYLNSIFEILILQKWGISQWLFKVQEIVKGEENRYNKIYDRFYGFGSFVL